MREYLEGVELAVQLHLSVLEEIDVLDVLAGLVHLLADLQLHGLEHVRQLGQLLLRVDLLSAVHVADDEVDLLLQLVLQPVVVQEVERKLVLRLQ